MEGGIVSTRHLGGPRGHFGSGRLASSPLATRSTLNIRPSHRRPPYNKNHTSNAMATFKETASTVLILLWTVFVGYIVFYWGFYKGGGYILHHWIAPSVASAHATPPGSTNATAATSSGGTITIDILKT